VSAALEFVDCSSNNGTPNLADYARAGHKHISLKASEGANYYWPAHASLTDQAHKLGLRVGHYHWLRPEQSATAQAAYFVHLVKPLLAAGDWLMTDFEATQGFADPADVTRAAQLHEFNTHVAEALPGFPLYVYTGNWYLAGKLHCQAECRRWPVVMSDYSGVTELPNPYRLTYAAWQFTDKAHVPGFAGPVDYNRWLAEPEPPEVDMTPEQTEQMITEAMLALTTGEDHGRFTRKKHPHWVLGKSRGLFARLTKVEKDEAKA